MLPIIIAYVYTYFLIHNVCAPLTPIPDATPLTFNAVGTNSELDAWYRAGTRDEMIILAGGAFSNASAMRFEFEAFHDAGYHVFSYDTRTCADPAYETSLGYTEIEDLKAAITLAQTQFETDQIGVLGFSMGGATAIMTAAQDDRIDAVVAIGNYATLTDQAETNSNNILIRWFTFWLRQFYEWQLGLSMELASPIDVIDQISPRPVLLIHGSDEMRNSRGDDQFDAALEPKSLFVIEGASHGQHVTVGGDAYRQRILTFFDDVFGEFAP